MVGVYGLTRGEDQQPEENGFSLVTIRYKSDKIDTWAVQMDQKSQIMRQEFFDAQGACT